MSKTNEDFGYYHLPNSLQFAQQKLQFGLGNLNHGFKHISSLFMIMSLNYLPSFEFYLFNLTNLLFLTFLIIFLLTEIYFRNKTNLNLSNLLLSLFLVLFLAKFARLAEYGSDLSGQIVISIYFFLFNRIVFLIIKLRKRKNQLFKNFFNFDRFCNHTKVYLCNIFSFIFDVFLFCKKQKVFITKFIKI